MLENVQRSPCHPTLGLHAVKALKGQATTRVWAAAAP